jgi:hypothetical protein
MLVLSELDLKLAFERRRALREDVEDQPVAIEHANLQLLLEIAFLPGAQRLIHEDQLGLRFARKRTDLVDLSAADEVLGIWAIPPCQNLADDARTRGFRECAEFFNLVVETRSG